LYTRAKLYVFLKRYIRYTVIIPLVLIPIMFLFIVPIYNLTQKASTVFQYRTYYAKVNAPKLYNDIMPRTINDTNDKFLNYEKIIIGDGELVLKSPWLKIGNVTRSAQMEYYEISNNKYIVIMDRTGPFLIRSLLDQFIPQYKYKVFDYFGEEIVLSDFKLARSVISTKPKDLKPTMSKEEIGFRSGLISLEDYYLPDEAKNGIFEFNKEDLSVIQFGDPNDKNDTRVVLEIFINEDHKYSIMLYNIDLKQDEVDFVISSLEY